jgi:hypothetical protein
MAGILSQDRAAEPDGQERPLVAGSVRPTRLQEAATHQPTAFGGFSLCAAARVTDSMTVCCRHQTFSDPRPGCLQYPRTRHRGFDCGEVCQSPRSVLRCRALPIGKDKWLTRQLEPEKDNQNPSPHELRYEGNLELECG